MDHSDEEYVSRDNLKDALEEAFCFAENLKKDYPCIEHSIMVSYIKSALQWKQKKEDTWN